MAGHVGRAPQIMIGDRMLGALGVLCAASGPLRLQDVASRAEGAPSRGDLWRPALARLVVEGKVTCTGTSVKLYRIAERPVTKTERTPDSMDLMLTCAYALEGATVTAMATAANVTYAQAQVLVEVMLADDYLRRHPDKPGLYVAGTLTRPLASLAAPAAPSPAQAPQAEAPSEREAEMAWTLAARLRQADATLGLELGLAENVREALELMAETRRQLAESR